MAITLLPMRQRSPVVYLVRTQSLSHGRVSSREATPSRRLMRAPLVLGQGQSSRPRAGRQRPGKVGGLLGLGGAHLRVGHTGRRTKKIILVNRVDAFGIFMVPKSWAHEFFVFKHEAKHKYPKQNSLSGKTSKLKKQAFAWTKRNPFAESPSDENTIDCSGREAPRPSGGEAGGGGGRSTPLWQPRRSRSRC